MKNIFYIDLSTYLLLVVFVEVVLMVIKTELLRRVGGYVARNMGVTTLITSTTVSVTATSAGCASTTATTTTTSLAVHDFKKDKLGTTNN